MVKFRNSGGGLSSNLEDRRAMGGKGIAAGGGVVGIIVVVVLSLLGGGDGGGAGGIDITDIFGQIQTGGGGSSGTVDPADEPLVQEMSDALDDIQTFWASEDGLGSGYDEATLVLFTDGVSTGGCGNAPSSVGPFYCPTDQQAYIDLSFFKELDSRFGAPGDFARVYVLAHEIGHHVQNLEGTSDEVRQAQQSDPVRANELSVRLELQADCYAGSSDRPKNETKTTPRTPGNPRGGPSRPKREQAGTGRSPDALEVEAPRVPGPGAPARVRPRPPPPGRARPPSPPPTNPAPHERSGPALT